MKPQALQFSMAMGTRVVDRENMLSSMPWTFPDLVRQSSDKDTSVDSMNSSKTNSMSFRNRMVNKFMAMISSSKVSVLFLTNAD